MADDIRINARTTISARWIGWETSHASGPGGQNVNKVASRVTLRFPLFDCPDLSREQKRRIHRALRNRVTREGELLVSAEDQRSQQQNRDVALARFRSLLADALRPRKARKPTRPTRGSKERRLKEKKKRGERKASRRISKKDFQ
jgi:ribosome-associated protein